MEGYEITEDEKAELEERINKNLELAQVCPCDMLNVDCGMCMLCN